MNSKRVPTILTTACTLALSFALAACGGGPAGSGSDAGASAQGTAAAADPAEKFVGTWKFAAAEMEGITMTGDLSGVVGESAGVALTLESDGTGAMTFGDDEADVAWETNGDDAITLSAADDDSSFAGADVRYEDGVLAMEMSDDEFTGAMYLTPDGTMAGVAPIDVDAATVITSEDDVVGTWRLAGMSMMGASMYGDADDLAAMAGGDDEDYVKLEIKPDGTTKIMGMDATWEVGSDGAAITAYGVELSVRALDGGIVVSVGDFVGMDMAMWYTR